MIQNRKWAGIVALAVAFAMCGARVGAQQPAKVPKIGYLSGGSSSINAPLLKAFQMGLNELGYVEGKNIAIEYRFAEAKPETLPDLAAELVRLKVDVIVAAGGAQQALGAKKATTTVPVVMTNVGDPVAFGLVTSLARPGGNITGLASEPATELHGKRLELLKESFPKLSRVAVLWSPDNPGSVVIMRAIESPARSLGIKLQSVEIRQPNGLEQTFSAMKGEFAEALVPLNSPLIISQLKRIVELAAKSRLPTMSVESRWTEAGALMSYGTNYADLYRRAAVYVDKILKGAKPADLPVEQPTKFDLAINLKTAKQIGVTIPQTVLYKADKVIK